MQPVRPPLKEPFSAGQIKLTRIFWRHCAQLTVVGVIGLAMVNLAMRRVDFAANQIVFYGGFTFILLGLCGLTFLYVLVTWDVDRLIDGLKDKPFFSKYLELELPNKQESSSSVP